MRNWGGERWWVGRPALKIYVGDGVLDVPEGPRNEILLRDILCAMNLKIIIKNAAARWGGGK